MFMLHSALWVLTTIRFIKAMVEAESYNGPSLIICYAPCINHGIKGGVIRLSRKRLLRQATGTSSVTILVLADEGKNPFALDSNDVLLHHIRYFIGEVRYNSLTRSFPERAEKLFEKAEKVAADKYAHLEKLASLPDAE